MCVALLLSFLADPIQWVAFTAPVPDPKWGESRASEAWASRGEPRTSETRVYWLSSFFAVMIAGVGGVVGVVEVWGDPPNFGQQPALWEGAGIGLGAGILFGVLSIVGFWYTLKRAF